MWVQVLRFAEVQVGSVKHNLRGVLLDIEASKM